MAKQKITSEAIPDDRPDTARQVYPIVDMSKNSQRVGKDFRPVLDAVTEPDDIELLALEQQLELGLDPDDLARGAEGELPRAQGKAKTSS